MAPELAAALRLIEEREEVEQWADSWLTADERKGLR